MLGLTLITNYVQINIESLLVLEMVDESFWLAV